MLTLKYLNNLGILSYSRLVGRVSFSRMQMWTLFLVILETEISHVLQREMKWKSGVKGNFLTKM